MSDAVQRDAAAAEGYHSDGRYGRDLAARAQKLDKILTAQDLALRITVGQYTEVIGARSHRRNALAEFYFAQPNTFVRLMMNLRLYEFAKAYFDGNLVVHGPFSAAMDVLYAINVATDVRRDPLEWAHSVLFRFAKATLPSAARNFESNVHYSIDARGYGLFLDPYLQYTCAKFYTPQDSLETAQLNKFSLIAELAEQHIGPLKGARHLDVGCGWGGLIAYFQEHFGTQSTGITNNAAQKDFSAKHFGQNAVLADFEFLGAQPTQYDLITIVGMAEHLTPRRRTQLFDIAKRRLSDRGVIYFQCIAKPDVWIGGDAYRVAYEDVFPGHYLETAEQMEARFERDGFEVVYAVDDAADYGRTTALWAQRIESNREQMISLIGERDYRIFLGYLSYASVLFAKGRGSLRRYLLKKVEG